jgi:phosphoribosylglycinamide formyltransferase-1
MTPSTSPSSPAPRLRLAGLISGGGRTLLNLHDTIGRGELDAEVALVIASRPDIAGVARVRDRDIPVVCPARDDHDAISAALRDAGVDLVCLCGYLRWLRIDPWMRGRVINIHPSLLPAHGGHGMFGDRVHAAVLAAGDTRSGCTVHFVDEEYDHGPTILQRPCPVEPGDDVAALAARVFAEECIAYPEAVRAIAAGRVRMDQGQAVWSDPPTQATAARR